MISWETARLVMIPLISALTGYITNYIAVRMLFHPRKELNILGLKIQGLIPKRRPQIASNIAETVESHLISHDDITKIIDSPELQAQAYVLLDKQVTVLLTEKLVAKNPMIGMVLKGQMLDSIKAMIMEELMQTLPKLTEAMMDYLENNLDFKQIVEEKIDEFDLEKFESIILRIAARELRSIEILGGALGFFIGLLTVGLLSI